MPNYDRAQTMQRIFAAAVVEFADEGIAGARVDRIAERAESNKALIYSYFGNKEELFAAVLERRLTELAEAVPLRPEAVAEYVGELFDFHVRNPDVAKLVQHEAAQFAPKDVPHRAERRAHYQDKIDAVAEAQRRGLVNAHLDPSFVVMTMISLVTGFTATPQIADMIIGECADPQLLARYRAHLLAITRQLLDARADSPR
jgi:AcrR family transcriptional regulator